MSGIERDTISELPQEVLLAIIENVMQRFQSCPEGRD